MKLDQRLILPQVVVMEAEEVVVDTEVAELGILPKDGNHFSSDSET
jgi:hypothetical protein